MTVDCERKPVDIAVTVLTLDCAVIRTVRLPGVGALRNTDRASER